MKLAPVHQSSRSTQAYRQLSSSFVVALCVAAPLLGCGSSSPSNKAPAANIILTNANNYSSTSELKLPDVPTASGQDVQVCWTDLTKDLQCHDVVPKTTIKNISLVRFASMTHADAQKTLISGNLSPSDVALYREANTDGTSTCVQLSSMKGMGGSGTMVVSTDYVEKSSDTYVLIASKSTQAGQGAESMVFVTPTAGNSTTTVDIPSGCNNLTFTADLHDLTPVTAPPTGPWIVDWSAVTQDSEKKDPNFVVLDSYDLILGYYDKTVTEIENDFFNVETLATKMWRIKNISGTTRSKDLGSAQDVKDGSFFTGFDQGDGLWALGLQCPDCQNPAPIFLTILKPSTAH